MFEEKPSLGHLSKYLKVKWTEKYTLKHAAKAPVT